ncbi:unnamed protein product [Amoebophrya sp. A120]|nr:unnamed protein product [Amoebophrya sp. A120]|eukprot:GSA120T00007230001.1
MSGPQLSAVSLDDFANNSDDSSDKDSGLSDVENEDSREQRRGPFQGINKGKKNKTGPGCCNKLDKKATKKQTPDAEEDPLLELYKDAIDRWQVDTENHNPKTSATAFPKCYYLESKTKQLFIWDQNSGVLFQFEKETQDVMPIWQSGNAAVNAEIWTRIPIPPTDANYGATNHQLSSGVEQANLLNQQQQGAAGIIGKNAALSGAAGLPDQQDDSAATSSAADWLRKRKQEQEAKLAADEKEKIKNKYVSQKDLEKFYNKTPTGSNPITITKNHGATASSRNKRRSADEMSRQAGEAVVEALGIEIGEADPTIPIEKEEEVLDDEDLLPGQAGMPFILTGEPVQFGTTSGTRSPSAARSVDDRRGPEHMNDPNDEQNRKFVEDQASKQKWTPEVRNELKKLPSYLARFVVEKHLKQIEQRQQKNYHNSQTSLKAKSDLFLAELETCREEAPFLFFPNHGSSGGVLAGRYKNNRVGGKNSNGVYQNGSVLIGSMLLPELQYSKLPRLVLRVDVSARDGSVRLKNFVAGAASSSTSARSSSRTGADRRKKTSPGAAGGRSSKSRTKKNKIKQTIVEVDEDESEDKSENAGSDESFSDDEEKEAQELQRIRSLFEIRVNDKVVDFDDTSKTTEVVLGQAVEQTQSSSRTSNRKKDGDAVLQHSKANLQQNTSFTLQIGNYLRLRFSKWQGNLMEYLLAPAKKSSGATSSSSSAAAPPYNAGVGGASGSSRTSASTTTMTSSSSSYLAELSAKAEQLRDKVQEKLKAEKLVKGGDRRSGSEDESDEDAAGDLTGNRSRIKAKRQKLGQQQQLTLAGQQQQRREGGKKYKTKEEDLSSLIARKTLGEERGVFF